LAICSVERVAGSERRDIGQGVAKLTGTNSMSDDPVTRILAAIDRLRVDVLARLDRLEVGSESAADFVPADIIAHVQGIGDVEGNLGDWIGQPRSGRWIEGFSIAPPNDIAPGELLCRVVLGRDQLSPWTPSDKYSGSTSLAMPLRGFCLMLRGTAASNYECSYSATFVDGSDLGSIPAGQVCASATLAPLEAFQVILRPRGA
jgi:hypothetical protein